MVDQPERHAHGSTSRFSDRVENYVRYRPGYPRKLLEALMERTGLGPGKAVADLGSGTGISATLLLESGCGVFAVEPNAAMRAAAEERLGGEPRFHSVDGTAEATGLPDASVGLVTAAQAFHWFDRERTRAEMHRILWDDGLVALFWNSRKTDSTPFLRDYEALLRRFGTDYAEIDHTRIGPESLAPFFGGPFERRVFPNRQVFGFDGLRGRLLSSSYVPGPGHPDHPGMLEELHRIFDRHQQGGRVTFEYDTELYLGRLA
jgi:ubiquinone/menaquinone biosynthesis C-methylase UbiE